MDKNTLLTHLNNELYQDARKLWSGVQVQQIVKGAEKYPEPLNPESWSMAELIMHAMQENVDQTHYLTALLHKASDQEIGIKTVPVKIKRLCPDAVIPQYARPLDAGFDLVAVEDVLIMPGESAKVPTGLAIALPPGYELQVRPRSGVSAKTKLRISNAPGTIDAGFRGEIGVLIDNVFQSEYKVILEPDSGEEFIAPHNGHVFDLKGNDYLDIAYGEYPHGTYIIRKGDRIAQGVLAVVPIAQFKVVDELDETDRGSGGFGSSGVSAL